MAAVFTLLLFVPVLRAADAPADLVRYRQAVMKSMGGHLSASSLVVKRQVSNRSQLAAHGDAISATAVGLAAFFPPETSPDRIRTSAKREIWKEWKTFSALAAKLERSSAAFADAARHGDSRKIESGFAAMSASCNECHQRFRNRDSE